MRAVPDQIYVLRALASGLVKIGCSANPRARLRQISQRTEDCELLATFPGHTGHEAMLHDRFASLRVPDHGREWFRPDAPLVTWLASLPAEHRRAETCRIRRRVGSFTLNQVVEVRARSFGIGTPADYRREHGHFFVSSAVPGCRACVTAAAVACAPDGSC